MIKLPEHKCGLTLEHNDHKGYYQSVADYIDDNSRFQWPSDEEKQKAIDTNEIWTLHWYPETPVGFYAVAAASLDELLRFANKDGADN